MDSGPQGSDGDTSFGTGGWVQSLLDLFALAGCAHWPSAAAIDLMASIEMRRAGSDGAIATEEGAPPQ